ncbi:MAG: bacterioferritin-associated ferredoxin [Pseudomonadales bacterium]
MYVCICTGTTDRQIKKAVAEGAHSLEALQLELGVATQCGECACLAQEVLSDALCGNLNAVLDAPRTENIASSPSDGLAKPLFYNAV